MYLIAGEYKEAKFFNTWALFFPHRRSLEEPSNYTILGLYLAYSSCMNIKYRNVQGKNYTSSTFYILLYRVKRNKMFNFQTVTVMAERTLQVLNQVKFSKYYTNVSREIYSTNAPAEKQNAEFFISASTSGYSHKCAGVRYSQ